MKLHPAFLSTPKKLWVRNASCFCQNCFGLSNQKQYAMVGEWLICSEKGNPQYYQLVKRLWIPENEAAIVPGINDHMAAGYDRKIYIGNVLEVDESDPTISLYEHTGTLTLGSLFR